MYNTPHLFFSSPHKRTRLFFQDESLTDHKRQEGVEEILGKMRPERFHKVTHSTRERPSRWPLCDALCLPLACTRLTRLSVLGPRPVRSRESAVPRERERESKIETTTALHLLSCLSAFEKGANPCARLSLEN